MMPALDPQKLVGDTLRLGTIETVDLAQATCTVRMGEIVTGDVPWLAPRAGATCIWSPPSIGEQCLLLCPDGDDAGGIVLPGLFSDANPAPSTDPIDLIAFTDGAVLSYDPGAHALEARLPAGATVTIIADGGFTLTGDINLAGNMTMTGNLDVRGDIGSTGTVTGDQDVVGGGKSLKGHRHLGVMAGGAVSGPPQ